MLLPADTCSGVRRVSVVGVASFQLCAVLRVSICCACMCLSVVRSAACVYLLCVRACCALSDLAGAAEHDDEHQGQGDREDVDDPEPGTLLSSRQHLCGQAGLGGDRRVIIPAPRSNGGGTS